VSPALAFRSILVWPAFKRNVAYNLTSMRYVLVGIKLSPANSHTVDADRARANDTTKRNQTKVVAYGRFSPECGTLFVNLTRFEPQVYARLYQASNKESVK
jgi:hypothetical protein